MRTTVSLDDDIVAEVERLRREEGIGVSEAVNRLARGGVESRRRARGAKPYRTKTARVGVKIAVDNVAEVLDLLDDEERG